MITLRVLVGIAFLSLASIATAADRPNIVMIMVDDTGFSDIGPYGSEIPTPHLDALAAGGAKFSQFYNTGRCCPTRATLLTGISAIGSYFWWANASLVCPKCSSAIAAAMNRLRSSPAS